MSNWSEGYVSEVNYTSGYYKELNPQHFIAPLLAANIAPPQVINACELGFGMGVSLNIHAAATQAKWYATDFNPSHALFARHLASSFGGDEKVLIADQPFQTFCQREDLPEFDYIGLHGIWSWITPENRQIIVDFIARKLKVGGVLYISYNTLPGWAPQSPIQHLISRLYYNQYSAQHSHEKQIKTTLQKAEEVFVASTNLTSQSPGILEVLERVKGQNINYVSHEFLNQNWTPMYFAELEKMLAEAKMSFACSSCYLEDYDLLQFSEEQQALLNDIQDPSMKQTIKDFLLNTRFRRDFWVKGKRQLSAAQTVNAWKEQRVILVVPAKEVSLTIARRFTTALNDEYVSALLAILGDNQIHSVAELCQKLPNVPQDAICQLLAIFAGRDEVMIAKSEAEIAACYPQCRQLNIQIANELFGTNSLTFFASPVTGGGIYLSELEQLFISYLWDDIPQTQWLERAWARMQTENKIMLREGKSIEGEKANLEEIERLIKLFMESKLQIVKGLQLV